MKDKVTECLNIVKKECIDLILRNNNKINKLFEKGKIKKDNDTIKFTPLNFDLKSSFISLEIQDIIYNDIDFVETIKFHILETLFVVKLYSNSKLNKINKNEKNRVKKMLETLSITIGMSLWTDCSLKGRKIIINLFDINKPKLFVPYKKVIEPKHVNSAYTVPCRYTADDNEDLYVVIFRNEEWEKVLFHELMHLYSYDIELNNKRINTRVNTRLSKIFNIECEFNLEEAYCEFWGRILWCLWKNKGIKKQINKEIERQQLWSIYQGIVVLTNTGLYENALNLSEDKKIIKHNPERTSAFSYYVICGLMMSNMREFLIWCFDNNEFPFKFSNSLANINNLITLIRQTLNDANITDLWFFEKENLPDNFCKNSLTAKMTI
jgi:hypothetical protein